MGAEVHFEIQAACFEVRAADFDRLADDVAEVGRAFVELHLSAGDAGYVQQVVDEPGFQFDVAADHGDVLAVFGGELGV